MILDGHHPIEYLEMLTWRKPVPGPNIHSFST